MLIVRPTPEVARTGMPRLQENAHPFWDPPRTLCLRKGRRSRSGHVLKPYRGTSYKEYFPPRTLQKDYTQGHTVVLGGGAFHP